MTQKQYFYEMETKMSNLVRISSIFSSQAKELDSVGNKKSNRTCHQIHSSHFSASHIKLVVFSVVFQHCNQTHSYTLQLTLKDTLIVSYGQSNACRIFRDFTPLCT